MQREIGTDGMQPVGHGNHRRDTDPATHQQGVRGLFDQRKMVDRGRDENTPPFLKNPVHQLGATAPCILAQHGDLIAAAVCRITAQRVLAEEFGGDDHINMRTSSGGRQSATIGASEFIFGNAGRHPLGFADDNLDDRCLAGCRVYRHVRAAHLRRGVRGVHRR